MIWYTLAAFSMYLSYFIQCNYRSKWVGVIVTLILIAASVYKGFFHNEWIIFLDVVSILAGYVIIDNLEFHKHQD